MLYDGRAKYTESSSGEKIKLKSRLHIHDFLYDSPRFLIVRKIGMDRDELWRKVEIFSVTTIPVRMSTILVRCLSLWIYDGNVTVNED